MYFFERFDILKNLVTVKIIQIQTVNVLLNLEDKTNQMQKAYNAVNYRNYTTDNIQLFYIMESIMQYV